MLNKSLFQKLRITLPTIAVALLTATLSSPVSYAADSTITAKLGDTYTIDAGYYDGKTTIEVPTLASQTPGSATSSDILLGKTAWVNGKEVLGSIPTVTLTGGTDTSTGGYKATIPATGYTGASVQSVTIPKGILSGGTDTSTGGYKATISKETYVGASDQSVTIAKGTLTGGTDTTTGGYKATIAKETYVGASDQSVTIPKGTLSGGTDTSNDGYKATIAKETYVGAADQTVTLAKASVTGAPQSDGSFKYSIAGGKYTGASGSSDTIEKLTPTYSTGSSQTALLPGGEATLPADKYIKDQIIITGASMSGTYTYPANSTGAKYDMGVYNTNRYVDATNVYAKGKADGVAETKKGTATAAQVLTGYTFTNGSSVGASGSMPNRGNLSKELNPNSSHTLDAGYYSGGTIKAKANTGTYTFPANSTGAKYDMGVANLNRYVDATNVYAKGKADGVAETKKGNATTDYVLSGYTFTSASAGVNASGGMANRGAITSTTLTASTFPTGYYTSSSISANPSKTVGNGTAGSITADGNTTSSDITLGSGKQVKIPSGFYSSDIYVKNGGGNYDFAFARVGAYGRLVDLVNGTCNYMGNSCTMRGITFRSNLTEVPDLQTTYTVTFYAPTNNCDLIYTNSATMQSGEVALAVKHCTSTNDYIQFVSNHTNVGAIVFVKLY